MRVSAQIYEQLMREHGALLRDYGRVQVRCSEQMREQAREIARLKAQAMRLRAEVIARETALAWAREDRAALEQSIPGLPSRVKLARRLDTLRVRIQDLMRERLCRDRADHRMLPARASYGADDALREDDPEGLEARLSAADLVICQTGCLSHGAYWRVQDHCQRTGKACVLVEAPGALRIVHIHRASDDTEIDEQARA